MPEPITIASDHVRVRIDQERGANIIDAIARTRGGVWLPMIGRNVPGEDTRANPASFIMAPWCNRVRDAVFVCKGRRVALKADPREGHAMHGDVRKRPWRILDRSPVSALLSFDSRDFADVNFPWAFTMRARFEVDDAGLSMEVSLTNESEEPFPCGIGIHPYFPREQTPTTKHVLVRAACDGRFPSERCMPTGPARHDSVSKRLCEMLPIAAGYQMDSLTGYQQRCEIEWPTGSRLVMTSSGNHGQMVFFAPTDERGREMPFFAVEPMTISADGFNMLSRGEPHDHNGVTILTPGETLKTRHRFEMHAV